jgi:hypothetical protein
MTRRALLLGLGLDGDDGHVRLTKGPDFRLLGGSEGTHARMLEHAMRLQDELARRGKRLADVEPDELRAIVRRIGI